MIEQIMNFKGNVLAFAVIGGFSKSDEQFSVKLFEQKIAEGHSQVNVLIKLDELDVAASSIHALWDDMVWTLRNYTKIGRLAIVANSSVLKALVPLDNLFFQKKEKGRLERYFDIMEMEEAFKFVTSDE